MTLEFSGEQRKGVTVWLTGLPSAGKTTIAYRLSDLLEGRGYPVQVLDGDEVRRHLSKGLGFSREDRDENIRRIAYVAKLLTRAGAVVIVAAISPYRSAREEARGEIQRFVEVFVDCPKEECIRRDVKGLYQKALRGELPTFTGISDPYEAPRNPEVVVRTHVDSIEEATAKVLRALHMLGYLPKEGLDSVLPEGEA